MMGKGLRYPCVGRGCDIKVLRARWMANVGIDPVEHRSTVRRDRWVCALLLLVACGVSLPGFAGDSICYGTPSRGKLENGVPIAPTGANFQPYSTLGVALGRTHVHRTVAQVIADAYASLAQSHPATMFVYGESGWPEGGAIKPHRTHQNGLAVDFMVPVRDGSGNSVALPSDPANQFGYGLDFDEQGRLGELAIDFEAIAAHLLALHVAAQKRGIGVARVIIEPDYIAPIHATRQGDFIKRHIRFMARKAWVRHDEHYHVDFAITCKPLAG